MATSSGSSVCCSPALVSSSPAGAGMGGTKSSTRTAKLTPWLASRSICTRHGTHGGESLFSEGQWDSGNEWFAADATSDKAHAPCRLGRSPCKVLLCSSLQEIQGQRRVPWPAEERSTSRHLAQAASPSPSVTPSEPCVRLRCYSYVHPPQYVPGCNKGGVGHTPPSQNIAHSGPTFLRARWVTQPAGMTRVCVQQKALGWFSSTAE